MMDATITITTMMISFMKVRWFSMHPYSTVADEQTALCASDEGELGAAGDVQELPHADFAGMAYSGGISDTDSDDGHPFEDDDDDEELDGMLHTLQHCFVAIIGGSAQLCQTPASQCVRRTSIACKRLHADLAVELTAVSWRTFRYLLTARQQHGRTMTSSACVVKSVVTRRATMQAPITLRSQLMVMVVEDRQLKRPQLPQVG